MIFRRFRPAGVKSMVLGRNVEMVYYGLRAKFEICRYWKSAKTNLGAFEIHRKLLGEIFSNFKISKKWWFWWFFRFSVVVTLMCVFWGIKTLTEKTPRKREISFEKFCLCETKVLSILSTPETMQHGFSWFFDDLGH